MRSGRPRHVQRHCPLDTSPAPAADPLLHGGAFVPGDARQQPTTGGRQQWIRRTVKIGDKSCSLQPLVGGPNGLVPCQDDKPRDGGAADGQPQDETRDNRPLIDNNTVQTLSSKDIEAMKREDASGDAIVEALIANGSTFGNKTVFSQKYKLKEQNKYAPKVLLRRPSTRRFM
ncbi:uncharacterized protein LOC119311536 isoform X2 [Triticum dicoccoides]|uniref:uncharacterized protein LOC119311536 isoform X2 n=1 Tax=Triticum dicoccoides TaxID=85692 RepID=UPI001891D875|nr:uncharacterized protein LOC119311536 isoform X2 [Triticum dicoccoides]